MGNDAAEFLIWSLEPRAWSLETSKDRYAPGFDFSRIQALGSSFQKGGLFHG